LTDVLLDVRDMRVDLPSTEGTLHAVRGVDLHVARGETVCIAGESGCGKTLTALSLIGLLPKQARRSAKLLSFNGEDLAAAGRARIKALRGDRIGMIFQEPMTALNPCLTIGEQLTEVLRAHRAATPSASRERAVFLLDRVGISSADERLKQYPHQLSGGLRQRVMIAMALMCSPDLLIADEPTTALDVTIQAQILRLLRELQQEFGMGLLLITHDLGVVARVADRVYIMYAGQIVETGPVTGIFRDPKHPYTRGLMSCVPVLGQTRAASLGTIPGTVPSLVGEMSGCAFADRCSDAGPSCTDPGPRNVTLLPERSVRCVMFE
jgi:peptide/nickel transport system ATP-binding protein